MEKSNSMQAFKVIREIHFWFFYCSLKPNTTDIYEEQSNDNGYNGFIDAISEDPPVFKWFNQSSYSNYKRHNSKINKDRFIIEYPLIYSKLPGKEELKPRMYKDTLLKEYSHRVLILPD